METKSILNGLYSYEKLKYLATMLLELDPDYMISLTRLKPTGPELLLYNVTDTDKEMLIYGAYPMFASIEPNGQITHKAGYSGDVIPPSSFDSSRSEWSIYLEEANDFLWNELYHHDLALVQIWHRSFDKDIFPDIVDITHKIKGIFTSTPRIEINRIL